jgi:hypothetical protein
VPVAPLAQLLGVGVGVTGGVGFDPEPDVPEGGIVVCDPPPPPPQAANTSNRLAITTQRIELLISNFIKFLPWFAVLHSRKLSADHCVFPFTSQIFSRKKMRRSQNYFSKNVFNSHRDESRTVRLISI